MSFVSDGRDILNSTTLSAQGIRVNFAGENLTGPTDWSFSENHHVIVVHRAGKLKRLSSHFSSGLSVDTLPQVGDCWVIPAGSRYSAQAIGSSVEYCELHLPVGVLSRRMKAAAGIPDRFLYHAVEQLALMAGKDDDLSGLLCEQVIQNIRLHLGSDNNATGALLPLENQAAVMACLEEYLRDSLSRRHSLNDMAAFTGLAPSTLLRHFRRNFGQTPYRWLLDQRIRKSQELLRQTDKSVTEIAFDVGFSTPSHFADQFRKLIGFSPSEFRANVNS